MNYMNVYLLFHSFISYYNYRAHFHVQELFSDPTQLMGGGGGGGNPQQGGFNMFQQPQQMGYNGNQQAVVPLGHHIGMRITISIFLIDSNNLWVMDVFTFGEEFLLILLTLLIVCPYLTLS